MHRFQSDGAPDAPLLRLATPAFVPPPPLAEDFSHTGSIGTYGTLDDPDDGHDWADPDIVWRRDVPVNPDTEPLMPWEIELWSNHYGLPVGLHPEYTKYSNAL